MIADDPLLQQMSAAVETSITFLIAPEGFGKSRFIEQICSDENPLVFPSICLDCEEFSTPRDLMLGIMNGYCLSIQEVFPSELLDETLDAWFQFVLLKGQAHSGQPLLIVIDNAHSLSPAMIQLLDSCLVDQRLPFRWLFSGRGYPELSIQAYWQAGQVKLLDASLLLSAELDISDANSDQLTLNSSVNLSKIKANSLALLKSGQFAKVIDLLNDLDESLLLAHEDISSALIWSLIFSRKFNQAEYFLDLIHHYESDQGHLSTVENSLIKPLSRLDFLSLSLRLFQHEQGVLTEFDFRQLYRAGRCQDIRAFSLVILAYYQLQEGDIDGALFHAEKARVVLDRLGFEFLSSYADLIISLCDKYMGRGFKAVQYATSNFHRFKGEKYSLTWVNVNTAMLVVYYEQNQLERAQQCCELLTDHVNGACATEVIVTVHLLYARLLDLKQETKKSHRHLDQLSRILTLGKYDRFKSQVIQERCRQLFHRFLQYQDLSFVSVTEAVLTQSKLLDLYEDKYWESAKEGYSEEWERQGLALMYWLMMASRYDEAVALGKSIESVLSRCPVVARHLIVAVNLLSAEFLAGRQLQAARSLKSLISTYGWEAFPRSVFDEAPMLDKVLLWASEHQVIRIPKMFVRVFRNLLEQKVDEVDKPKVNPESVLTPKEHEIFSLVAKGLSNSQISQETAAALSTVKWHLKNIYSKLGVNNRKKAMLLAQKLAD